MNNNNFPTISSKQRVKIVNDLLKKEGFDLQKVADHLGMKYSTFTKLMQEDDYVYIKRDNQYYKFVRDEGLLTAMPQSDDEEITYIKSNFALLKSLIERHKDNNDFILDKRIFHSSSKIATKNFRISDDLYKQFVKTCDEHFPHLKIQDIIAQLLLGFVDQYPSQTK
ncbi:hypothetical protein [Metasolibacillus sp. FSL K6-0083]|uniref:hypothetical protein n=1 Tax=Metasolibacillus sp. FSL K6-0083 TaxID=2921416 RepID=UPI00315AE44A